MSAYAVARVNEDGVIEPSVEGTRMDPEEYAARLAKVQLKVEPSAIRALETLADLMEPITDSQSDTITRIYPKVLDKCSTCGADAHWHAESWLIGAPTTLCNECMQRNLDKYQGFTRIAP